MSQMEPLQLSASTLVSALGFGKGATWQALREGRSGLKPVGWPGLFDTWLGEVDGLDEYALPADWRKFDCRNHRLARAALQNDGFEASVAQAKDRYGASRIGVFVGTSTSGIAATEQAYREREYAGAALPDNFDLLHTHNIGSLLSFTQEWLGLQGIGASISTACSSSAKAFASAVRAIQTGWCEAAVVGGVDSLCLTTLYGFNSLQLVSSAPCRPWSEDRDGINIGEAAGFVLLEKPDGGTRDACTLLGYGESADAYHMSSPHPEGAGARAAMQQALARAGLRPADIDYINLHGTATPSNDAAEDAAVAGLFGPDVDCSSTKGWTGHTLGASGICEAIISTLCLQNDYLPENLNLGRRDDRLQTRVLASPHQQPVRRVLTNSFGFGGSNCSLIFGEPV